MSCNAGSFSEYTVVDVDSIVLLPDEIYQKSAAAVYTNPKSKCGF